MSPTLTTADVERIAALAHLELTDDEKQLFTRQLADILATPSSCRRSTRAAVPATAHVNARGSAERDDEPRPSLSVDDTLANAPDAAPDAGLFRVPGSSAAEPSVDQQTARAIRDDVASGKVSAVEVCQAALERSRALNPTLNAFNLIAADRALERAARDRP